jgi:hypothetical protein
MHDDPIDLTGGADATDDRRLATVRSLLAKAEATEFPEEAEAFFAKASELIARYAIDEALLWSTQDSRSTPEEARLVIHAPYLAQKAVLVHAVAAAHGCQAVRLLSGPGHRTETISVVGFPTDLRWVETLVTSLLVQLTSAMLARCPSGLSPSGSAGWRRSFIMGFADEVDARLRADRRAAARTVDDAAGRGPTGHGETAADRAAASVEVVLAERSEEVRAEFRRRFPHVRSSWASRGSSAAGHRAGRQAGREASLDRGAVGGRRALGPGGG